MVNGAGTVFIEVAAAFKRTGIRFCDNQQLLHIRQRISARCRGSTNHLRSATRGCDGSRVNASSALAIEARIAIRKFKK